MRNDPYNSISPRFALMRLRGLIRKEFLQVLRDPSSIAIAFVMPVILLILFGYGVSLDAKHVPVAIVAERPGPEIASLIGEFQNNEYFQPILMPDMHTAQTALMDGRIHAIIRLRSDFSRRLISPGDAPIQTIVNGVDANNARLTIGYIQSVWQQWLQRRSQQTTGLPLVVPVQLQQQIWFNREVRSRNFLVPGLIAIIMTLIGALLTALVMAREWERGTIEALFVTPVRMRDVILSKMITYFLLGSGGMLLSVTMAIYLFHVPLRGSFLVLFASSSLFLLAALGMGLLISTVARNQFVASLVAVLATFLPAFILSGFIFDINSMPRVVQIITHLIAARYFVSILQTVFLAGNVWPVILTNCLALVIMAAVLLTIVKRKTRKTLE